MQFLVFLIPFLLAVIPVVGLAMILRRPRGGIAKKPPADGPHADLSSFGGRTSRRMAPRHMAAMNHKDRGDHYQPINFIDPDGSQHSGGHSSDHSSGHSGGSSHTSSGDSGGGDSGGGGGGD